MDYIYSWTQPEQKDQIKSKVFYELILNYFIKQNSSNSHGYSYFQNEMPIHSAFTPHTKDNWINSLLWTDDNEQNSKINDRIDSLTKQALEIIKRKREYNKASTCGYEIQLQCGVISKVDTDFYPWNVKNKKYPQNMDGLHDEILDFYQYIMPTAEEQQMRQEVVARLKKVVLKEWPEAVIDVFGSFKTELYLPTSGIDVDISGKWKTPTKALKGIIERSGIASDCEVLNKDTVPIVKMTDKETEVRINISFNMKNRKRSTELMESFIKDYPQLPQLVVILKQYLLQRDLNEVLSVGISSYSLILMCVSFINFHDKKKVNKQKNLGNTLMSFLELYGEKFDYFNTRIRTKGDSYVPKMDLFKNMQCVDWSCNLCIEDPLKPGTDIGPRSCDATQVKLVFEYAFHVLSPVVTPQPAQILEDNISILGRIIRITPEVKKYRAFIKERFSRLNFSELVITEKLDPHESNEIVIDKNDVNINTIYNQEMKHHDINKHVDVSTKP